MIQNCLENKPLPIYGQGFNIRDWLHVDDHAEALYLLLKKGNRGETYNIGGNSERRNIDVVHEIVNLMAEIKQVPKEKLSQLITYVKDRPGHDMRYAIDASKIKRELGWEPAHSFSEGLKQTILWMIANQDWVDHVRSGSYRQWMEENYGQRRSISF